MEHRLGRRVQLDQAVRLVCNSSLIAQGRLCNVSASGAYVQLPLRLPLWIPVELEIEMENWFGTRIHRIPAYIVRNGSDGVGLEWSDFAPPGVVELLAPTQRDATEVVLQRASGDW